MKRSIMAVGPHCDDVEFQFGSTLLKYHREYGYRVVYVEATNNMSGAWMQKDGFPALPEGTYRREALPRDGHRTEYRVPWFIEMPQRKKEAERRQGSSSMPMSSGWISRRADIWTASCAA